MNRLAVGSVGDVCQVAGNKGVRHAITILDLCSLKVKVKFEINKTSQNIMAVWEEGAANYGEPQSLVSGDGAGLLLAGPPAAVCCWVPLSLDDEGCSAVREFQRLREAAQAVPCAGAQGAFQWGGRQNLQPPEDQHMIPPKVHRKVSSANAESDCHEKNSGRLRV